jgi:hypothetical protein
MHILWAIMRHMRKKATVEWRLLPNEELHSFFCIAKYVPLRMTLYKYVLKCVGTMMNLY